MGIEGIFILFQHFDFFINVHQWHRGFHAHSHAHPVPVMPVMVMRAAGAATAAATTATLN
jgi:hypothetical protein